MLGNEVNHKVIFFFPLSLLLNQRLITMKKILLATDFSDDGNTAFEFAILLTQKINGELIIAHTYTPPYVDAATPISLIDTMQTEMLESYQLKLDRMVNTAKEIGVAASSELVISGVVMGIETAIEERGIDYLVIGKTGDSGFLAKLIGNNATDIIQNVKIPTFVIPKAKEVFLNIDRILYGTQLEFSETSQLTTALEIANSFSAECKVLHVKAANEMDIRDDETFLEEIRSTFVNETFTVEIIKADTVIKGIKTAINLFQTDMLIVSSQSHSFLSQLFNPSTSKSLVNTVNIPVLVLHLNEIN